MVKPYHYSPPTRISSSAFHLRQSPTPKIPQAASSSTAGTEAVEFNGMLKFERPSLVSRKMAQQWILRRLEVLGLMEVKDSSHAWRAGKSHGEKEGLAMAKGGQMM